MISYDDFKKVEVKVGEILSAEKVPETDKLLKLMVNLGEEAPRQIVSGISAYFPDPQTLVGIKCFFVANLEPRTIKGLESNGMLFAAGGHDDVPFSLIQADPSVPPGTPAN